MRKPGLKLSLLIFLFLILIVPAPALAYGDPSGGFLFQVLTPIVAALWGIWMAFAHSIHKAARRIFAKMTGASNDEFEKQPPNEPPALTQQLEQPELSD